MLPNKDNTDDLEYLAHLGFAKTKIDERDIDELRSKIKNRTFSYNNGVYFSFISLIVGVFIGVSCFFSIYNQPKIYATTADVILKDTIAKEIVSTNKIIVLDTVKVQHENFIYSHKAKIIDTLAQAANDNDTIIIVPIEPINISSISDKNLSPSKIKYMPNASVIYLHDLKITNYSVLYFNKNQQVKLSYNGGLSASQANRTVTLSGVEGLKQEPSYYLHDIISEAMLYYKKGNYNQCINSLNTVSAYTNLDINCKFYYGMCYFNKKNFSKALTYFEDCISNTNNTFLQEALYYQALCLIETGNTDEAKTLLKQIVDDGEFYSQKAALALSKM